ncbi:MAG TPA: hypothetical protein VGS58_04125, partial [Candidatus Sulfopaludibacter sp.]|nr:hypothetical protein [Candidatus Sulfopaludibacter sp.]
FPFAATATAAPDPRFSAFNQTRYSGFSRYDSMQVSLRQRTSHGLTYDLNYTWSHCLATGTPWEETSGLRNPLASTYRDCATIDVRHALNADYTYVLPVHVASPTLGKLLNGWQISGATFSESGSPIFINSTSNSLLVNATGPTPAIPVAGVNPYSKGTPIAGVTGIGAYQWFNPHGFYSIWDNATKLCVNPATGTDVTGGNTPAACQFPAGANGTTLRGPLFNWTNFDLAKSLALTERIQFRFDAQFFNLFNHPNYANPSLTGVVNGQPGTFSNDGAITSLTSPATGLLGAALGGDTNPRMIAFQGKIVF